MQMVVHNSCATRVLVGWNVSAATLIPVITGAPS